MAFRRVGLQHCPSLAKWQLTPRLQPLVVATGQLRPGRAYTRVSATSGRSRPAARTLMRQYSSQNPSGPAAFSTQIKDMSVSELGTLLRQGEAGVQLIDVREDFEHQAAAVPGFKLYPLSRVAEWAPTIGEELDPAAPTVVLCHHGMRSHRAAAFLTMQAGFSDVSNVRGGIDAYSREVDSSIPQY